MVKNIERLVYKNLNLPTFQLLPHDVVKMFLNILDIVSNNKKSFKNY